MKLIKQHGRKYKGNDYYKHLIVIPNKLLSILKWNGGEELKAEVKDNKLIIEKNSK